MTLKTRNTENYLELGSKNKQHLIFFLIKEITYLMVLMQPKIDFQLLKSSLVETPINAPVTAIMLIRTNSFQHPLLFENISNHSVIFFGAISSHTRQDFLIPSHLPALLSPYYAVSS